MKVNIAISIILLYIIFATISSLILAIIAYSNKGNVRKAARLLIIGFMAPVVLACLSWFDAKYIEPNWIGIKQINVKSGKFSPGLKDVKIIQISDLHIENIGFREKELVRMVNALKPDVLLITGDFTNSENGLEPCINVLKELHATNGIYAILGNTDNIYFGNENKFIADLASAGVTVLRRDRLKLDFGEKGSFWLVGLSHDYKSQDDIGSAFYKIPVGEPKILMVHIPDFADNVLAGDYRPQLILAGHNHGGQFGIPFIRKHSEYASRSKYISGMFNIDGVPMYVNRGIGMKTRNYRFLCRPEITVVRLERS